MKNYFTPEERKLLLFVIVTLVIGALVEHLSTPEVYTILSKESGSVENQSDMVKKSSPESAADPLDINHASADDLVTLKGIGPTLAGRIVEAREKIGGFHTIDEIMSISGIGPKKFAAIREFVTCPSVPENNK